MTTLYIDRRNLTLSTQGDALVFHENEQRVHTVPAKILERICICSRLNLSTRVLGKLGSEGIGLLILNRNSQRPVMLMPNWKLDGKRRVAQYAQSQNPDFRRHAAQHLTVQKLQAQQNLLTEYGQPEAAAQMEHTVQTILNGNPDPHILRGLEGTAAARYFAALQNILPPSLGFRGRNRRPPRDPVNSLLSLGYTLLHFETVKHIQMCGLDPFIGFYHTPEHGRESLACDLLEPVRPQYDRWLLTLLRDQTFRSQDFSTGPQGCLLNKAARLRYYQHYEEWVKTLRADLYRQCRQLLHRLNPEDRDFQADELITLENPRYSNSQDDN